MVTGCTVVAPAPGVAETVHAEEQLKIDRQAFRRVSPGGGGDDPSPAPGHTAPDNMYRSTRG